MVAASGATFELPPVPQETARTASWLDQLEALAERLAVPPSPVVTRPIQAVGAARPRRAEHGSTKGSPRAAPRSISLVPALVFLRLAEDCGLERFGQLRAGLYHMLAVIDDQQ